MFKASIILTRVYLDFEFAIEAAIIITNDFNYCRYINASSHFCKSSYTIIVEKKISEFGSANYINILPCQKYLNIFNDLTAIKQTIIAYAHSIISIIKLRLSTSGFFTLYY